MNLSSLLHRFQSLSHNKLNKSRKRRTQRHAQSRAAIEALESRALLTPVLWDLDIEVSEDTGLQTNSGGFNEADSSETDETFTLQAGTTVESTGGDNGGVFTIRAGEDLIIEDGATVQGAARVELYVDDYGSKGDVFPVPVDPDPGTGGVLSLEGAAVAPVVELWGHTDDDMFFVSVSGIDQSSNLTIDGWDGNDTATLDLTGATNVVLTRSNTNAVLTFDRSGGGAETVTFRNVETINTTGVTPTVVDNADPVWDSSLPTSIDVFENTATGADINNPQLLAALQGLVTDTDDAELDFTAAPTTFSTGTTSVTFTATDDAGNMADATIDVIVSAIPELIITSSGDGVDGDLSAGQFTLREAIELANQKPGADTITSDSSRTINLTQGQLEITDDVTITGPGAASDLVIDAQSNSRVLFVSSTGGAVTLTGLTLTNGSAPATEQGGAVLSDATETLRIVNSVVRNSVADANGGGVRTTAAAISLTGTSVVDNSGSIGGGVDGHLSVELVDSVVSGNTATGNGGGVASGGSVTVTNSTISGNEAGQVGGGIRGSGDVTVTNSTISGNDAGISGGGIGAYGDVVTVSVTNSTISGNTAVSRGGGVFASYANVTVTNSTISGNTADNPGGGISVRGGSHALTNSTISGNTANQGGGIYGAEGASFLINNTVVAGNRDAAGDSDIEGSNLAVDALSANNLIGDAASAGGLTNDTDGDPAAGTNNIVGVDWTTVLENHDDGGTQVPTLADNGGPTQTIALKVLTSPAIDAGSNALAVDVDGSTLLTTDQRGTGFDRLIDGLAGGTATVDIGAYEAVGPAMAPLVVSTDTDIVDGDYSAGELSLREAILSANLLAGNNDITFDPAMAGSTILLTQGQLEITDDVTITGPGAASDLVIDAQMDSRVIDITSGVTDITFDAVTIRNGSTQDAGGGIRSQATGTLTVTNSTISGNTAGDDGGGIESNGYEHSVQITNSTISGNTAGDDGGGINSYGYAYDGTDSMRITNSTISGNTAGGDGGGIFRSHYNYDGTTEFLLNNTIVAGNRDSAGPNDIESSVLDSASANNLIGDAASAGGLTNDTDGDPAAGNNNIVGVDWTTVLENHDDGGTQVPTLTDNGGSTQTIALLTGSPAIDAGNNALAVDVDGTTLLVNDQRTFLRILDGDNDSTATVDIGAFEFAFIPATLEVSTDTDIVDGDYSAGEFSLREAILVANDQAGADDITFDAALLGSTFLLTGGQLRISDDLTITGPGTADDLIIDAQMNSRVFDVTSSVADVTFDALTIRNGQTQADDDNGGGIRSQATGTLTVRNSTITGNTAVNVQGYGGEGYGSEGYGGGIHANDGMLVITDSTVSGNTATYGGGGVRSSGDVDVTNSTFIGNHTSNYSYDGGGGGIRASGEITITASSFSGNTTAGRGAALRGANRVTVTDSVLSNNSSEYAGAGIRADEVILTNSSLVNNEARRGAGGVRADDVTVTNSTISGNIGAVGGGIRSRYGTVTVVGSTISGNSARNDGGGISAYGGSVNLTNSTVSGNTAGDDGGGIYGGEGASLTLTNSTVAGNSAVDSGGGISSHSGSNVTLGNTIIAGNTNAAGTSDIEGDSLTIDAASANNLIGDAATAAGLTNDADGDPTMGTNNIVGVDWTTVLTNDGTDPILADNGGPTLTIALAPFGPAVDAGNDALAVDDMAAALTTDQRGVARIADGNNDGMSAVDIGAVESFRTLVVSNNTDIDDGNHAAGELSLREAIGLANGTAEPESILFDASLIGQTILLTNGQLQIADDVVITGPGTAADLIIDAQGGSRVIDITSSAQDVRLQGLTIQNGRLIESDGAGIRSAAMGTLTIRDSVVTGNDIFGAEGGSGGSGGGISAGYLTVTGTTISGNSSYAAGGIDGSYDLNISNSTISGNTTVSEGAGIRSFGNLQLTSSTVTGNTLTGGDSYSSGAIWAYGYATVRNSTISGNSANSGVGGIHFYYGTFEISNTTISGNSSDSGTGGLDLGYGASQLRNTIIAGNSNANGSSDFANAGELSASNNLIGDAASAGGLTNDADGNPATGSNNIVGVDWLTVLENDGTDPTLADNGGATQTVALLAGSVAIDAGSNLYAAGLANDQRGGGFQRILDGDDNGTATVDIGAFEVNLPGSLRGFKFDDADGDGNFDLGELPVEGVSFTLTGTDHRGNEIDVTVQSGADGVFEFTGLLPSVAGAGVGTGYTITETVPAGFVATTPSAVTMDLTSGQDISSSDLRGVQVFGGEGNITPFSDLNFSFPFAGTTYSDDSVLGFSEEGYVLLGEGSLSNLFDSSPSASELVSQSVRLAPFWTNQFDGSNQGIFVQLFNDDADPENERVVITWDQTLSDNGLRYTAQMELTDDGTIAFRYGDIDLTGVNDSILIGLSPGGGASDPGSIDLTATSDSGSEATIYELFTDDPPSVDLQNSTITFTPNGSGGFGIAVTAGGVEVPTETLTGNLTFGNAAEATIQGVTFEDLNANGLQDAGEPALPGVDIMLTGSTGSSADVDLTVTSDGDGLFEFTGLAPSNSSGYTLTQTPPAGFSPTTLNTSNVVSSGDTDTIELGSVMGSVPNAFERLAPLGSTASRSINNSGDLPTASDTETFTFFAAADETYAAQITPDDAGAILTVTVAGVTGSFTSPAAGEPVILPPQLVAADQAVVVTVATDVATSFRMDVFRNTAFEQQVGDSADGNELAIAPQYPAIVGLSRLTDSSATQLETGNVFTPNVLTFNLTGSDLEDAVLTVTAFADLNGSSEFLTLDAEGVFTVNLFETGGVQQGLVETTVAITQAQMATLLADGIATFTITPSPAVDNLGPNSLRLTLLPISAPFFDVDEYTIDLTDTQPVDIVLAGIGGIDFSGETVELLDTDGTTVLATATPDPMGANADNYDLGLLDFTAPANGTYTLRLSSTAIAEYGIYVSASSIFESEPNNSNGDTLRNLPVAEDPATARGFLSGSDVDTFEVDLVADQPIRISTSTPFDTAGVSPANSLDPRLEIIHPDGTTVVVTAADNSGDGKNALASFFAPVAGTYQVRVRATSGVGEYELTVVEGPPGNLDIDGNAGTAGGGVDAATDGLLAIRYLFGLRGAPLIDGALGPGSTATAADVETGLGNSTEFLDVDGNGSLDASTDGLLMIRYMFGLRGAPLVDGAIGAGATRTTGAAVTAHLDQFLPPTPPPPGPLEPAPLESAASSANAVTPPVTAAKTIAPAGAVQTSSTISVAVSAALASNSYIADDEPEDLFAATPDIGGSIVNASSGKPASDSEDSDEYRSWLDAVGESSNGGGSGAMDHGADELESSLFDSPDINDQLMADEALVATFEPSLSTTSVASKASEEPTSADESEASEAKSAETETVDLIMEEWSTSGWHDA